MEVSSIIDITVLIVGYFNASIMMIPIMIMIMIISNIIVMIDKIKIIKTTTKMLLLLVLQTFEKWRETSRTGVF